MKLCKGNSGVKNKNVGQTKQNAPVQKKIEVFVPPNGVTPARVHVNTMNIYKTLPKGWTFAGKNPMQGTSGAPGYILVTNTKNLFARDKQMGFITIEEAKRTKIINKREYNFYKARVIQNRKNVADFHSGIRYEYRVGIGIIRIDRNGKETVMH